MGKHKGGKCKSASVGFSSLVRGSLEIVKRLLMIPARVVLFVLNAIGHMLGIVKSSLPNRIPKKMDKVYFFPGHIIPFVNGKLKRKDWTECDGTDGRPDLRERDGIDRYYIYKWDEFQANQRKEKEMNVNDFAKRVTLREGGKKSISIAQVKEVLRIVNDLLGGALYTIIRLMK